MNAQPTFIAELTREAHAEIDSALTELTKAMALAKPPRTQVESIRNHLMIATAKMIKLDGVLRNALETRKD